MADSGICFEWQNPSISPGDDLYRHANDSWIKHFSLPEDKACYGTLHLVNDNNIKALWEIISACESEIAGDKGLIARLAASFMNEVNIEELGLKALQADLETVRGAKNKAELAFAMASLQGIGLMAVMPGSPAVKGVFELMGGADANDPEKFVITLYQSGIGLPDEIYYRDERFTALRDLYRGHIINMLRLADLPEMPAKDAERYALEILALETALAAGHGSMADRRDPVRTNNHMSWAEIRGYAPDFPWDEWAAGWGFTDAVKNALVVQWPSYLKALSKLWQDTPLSQLRQWLLWRVLSGRSMLLSKNFDEENFHFNGKLLTGTAKQKPRNVRCVELCNLLLGDAVGELFVKEMLSENARQRITEMTENLFCAYRHAIENSEWLGELTKQRALEKLALFRADVGFPESRRDYRTLRMEDDLLANVRAALRYDVALEFEKVGKPLDTKVWLMPPQTTNAYYLAGQNKVVMMAGILQPPVFRSDADDAYNYGSIGAVIAHEISHGFDDQGSQYDGRGRLLSWWTDDDRKEFESRTKKLAAQFEGYVPEGLEKAYHVNSMSTSGENIADLGGLSIAVLAYKLSLHGKEAPVIEGLTGLQRLFLGWAQFWRMSIRPEEARRRIAVDVHSPNEFRANGTVRNIPEFYEAFHVTPENSLYLSPAERVKIW